LSLEEGGQAADTPGFSQLSFQGFEPTELSDCFPEFRERAAGCRFRGCLHVEEPGCEVKEAVKRGEIEKNRYRNYVQFLEEIKEALARRY
jgi:ribosome biogenesis GTPase